MTKRILFIILWAVGSLFGAAILIGVAFGIYASVAAVSGVEPTQIHFRPFQIACLVVPWIAAFVALLFGALGRLPGTRRSQTHT